MITPKEFLRIELEVYNLGHANPEFTELAKRTVSQVQDLPIKTVLDFGAGTGAYSNAFQKAGYEHSAYEIWEEHRNYIKEHYPAVKLVDKPITTDLLAFIETAEHMTDEELFKLFREINPTYILFSSTSNTQPDDESWGHINLKRQEEWKEFFSKLGYEFVKDLNYPTSWAKLFKKVS